MPDHRAGVPRPPLSRRPASHRSRSIFPRCARCGRPTGSPRHDRQRACRCGRRNRHPERHPRDHVHVGQQWPAQRGDPLARQCAGRGPVWTGGTLHRCQTPGCTCRCRSSGWADSAAVCCPHCWPAPRWSPSRFPRPETTLRLLEREQVTLFRGWPDQAEALARQTDSVAADLSSLRPGSLEALLPADQRAEPGARARLFGMTESFGPYCGYPADTDMPRSAWGSCGKPFDGMEVRIVDPDDGTPVPRGSDRDDPAPRTPHDAWDLPPQPRRPLHRRRLLPHWRSRPPRRRRLHVLPRSLRRHVQGQRRHRLPERGRGRAAHDRRCPRRLRHGGRRGRRRRRDIRAGCRRPSRRGAPAAERLQGPDGVADGRLR